MKIKEIADRLEKIREELGILEYHLENEFPEQVEALYSVANMHDESKDAIMFLWLNERRQDNEKKS